MLEGLKKPVIYRFENIFYWIYINNKILREQYWENID